MPNMNEPPSSPSLFLRVPQQSPTPEAEPVAVPSPEPQFAWSASNPHPAVPLPAGEAQTEVGLANGDDDDGPTEDPFGAKHNDAGFARLFSNSRRRAMRKVK